ncbi:26S proteasome non-ATPase regulatory subunit 5-like [Neocloeon triangulifer]|uniref:26S proteasome non-ATPase regulatory subunit 5-like n=1 Tax=Neocloeon triangulifer TaxID=2078957 RepID=UPI00286F58DA|nr:26S proteasome non-ATPase regulatory subunit 5-like [Neocloeon triangulifer]
MTVKDNEWFREKVATFTKDDIPVMAEELRKLDRDTRKNLYTDVDFHGIVRGLTPDFDGGSPAFFESFADLVRLLFEFKKPSETFVEFHELFSKMVEHMDVNIRSAGVSPLVHLINSHEIDCLVPALDYLCRVAKLASNPDIAIAAPGLNALTSLVRLSPEGSRLVLLGAVGEVLKADWESVSEVIHIRVFNLAVDAACASEESLKVAVDSKILFHMQEWLESDKARSDPLSLVNIIECFGKLSKIEWGFNFLASSGILIKLEDSLVSENLGPMQSIVMPELYELFGNLCQNVPEKILHECPRFVPHILQVVSTASDSPHIIRAEIAMIGQVATKLGGKFYLSQQNELLDSFFTYLKKCVHSGAQEDKMCVLDTSAALLFVKSEEQAGEICLLTKNWFENIFTSVRHVFEMCNEPFTETVLPALQLLLVISQQPWGENAMAETPGLLEWLINREAACGVHKGSGTGGNPDVLRAKHDIAKVLSYNPDLKVTPRQRTELADFVQQGPFFKRGLYEVATEAPGN